MSEDDTRTSTIRQLNDRCRREFVDCRVLITTAVQALDAKSLTKLVEAVKNYDRFDSDNDPYGEHDFGVIELFGANWFWKFDYYALDLQGGSEDPTDPELTCRVLTILKADEY